MSQVRALVEEAISERRTGALVAGDGAASLYLLVGEPHHSVVRGAPLSGLDAVREVGRLAAVTARATWRPHEPLGPGRSLAGTAVMDVLAALDAGALLGAPDLTALTNRVCDVVAATLHRHGERIQADIRAATGYEELRAVVSGVRRRTVRGVTRVTLLNLAESLERELERR